MDIKQNFHEVLLIICLLGIDQGLSFMTDDDYFDEPSFNRCPWIRNKLKNGRVRYRYKGRVAKFLCDSGFELAGKRSSTCVRGQWSNPVPVCVARGCPRVAAISNGRITEMYRGALLVYDCNPGYILDGNPTIHCDGRRWNMSPPVCVIAAENPETYCDFENPDLCGWTHDPNHDFDWQRNQFSTPSGHVGTGPAFDHTFGENKGGFYLYIEASSPRKINDTARLFSPVYSEDFSGGCFTFWYHMYGATTGGLRVYLKPESHVFDELKPTWQKFGDQGNQWQKGHMIVPVLHENFQIVLEGVRGESYVGDSAIDDVRLTSNLCDSDDNSTDITETVDQYSCRGRCQESGSESACGCNANCVDEHNFCCRDYYTICTAGNSTTVQNTDEPLPEDYTTSSTATPISMIYTTLQHTEDVSAITTHPQAEGTEITKNTDIITLITLTSTSVFANPDNYTEKPTPSSTESVSRDHTIVEKPTITETTILSDAVSSSSLKTETSAISTKAQTTHFISTSTSISITDTTATETSFKTTFSSITPQITSTTLQTTTPTTKLATTSKTTTSKTTTSETTTSETTTSETTTAEPSTERTTTAEPTTERTTTAFPILTTYLDKSTQNTSLHDFKNDSTTSVSSNSSISTDIYTPSTFAATSPKTESTTLLTTTLTSTRKTYNLRPRNRTSSTTAYTTVPVTVTKKPTSTSLTENVTDSTLNTTPRSLTSWYRYSVFPFTQKQTTSSSIVSTSRSTFKEMSTKSRATSETSTEIMQYTTKAFSRFTKPTKSSLPKTSDFYESKSKTTSSSSSVPVVVSVVIVILICLVAGLAYYLRKKRSKRQSKLSDDSEMRFLPDSDYMDYSDASNLDKILVK